MKVLAIIGSPRKGESYKAAELIRERLIKKGDVDFEYLFLRDYSLGNCRGCHLCIMKGPETCPLKDDRAKIEEKMREADGVIFVSPIYSQNVTALMKNFIDHLSYLWHRPYYFGKKAMAVAIGGGMFKETLSYMKVNANNWGFHLVSELGVPHPDSLKPKFRDKLMKKIDRQIDKFYNSLKENELPIPGIKDLMWFTIWKGNSIACRESLPSDYPYWKEKGWIDGDYFYKTRINLFKKGIIKLFGFIGGIFMRRMYEGY